MSEALAVPDQDDDAALAIVVEAEELVVNDQATFEYAAVVRRTVKDMIDTITARWKPIKQKQDQAKRLILDQEKAELATPERVLAIVNKKLADWEKKQRLEKVIAEARAAEEAQRIEAARPAPLPGAPPPMPVVVPAAPVEMPKAAGLGFQTYYKVEIIFPMAFIKAVADGWGSPQMLEPNLSMLNDLAKRHKGQIEIPGGVIHEDRRPRG
jgi:hypothetical protein